jgi:Transposase
MPKRYPAEFRRRVVELVRAGRSVAEVAGDLGVTSQTPSATPSESGCYAYVSGSVVNVPQSDLVSGQPGVKDFFVCTLNRGGGWG